MDIIIYGFIFFLSGMVQSILGFGLGMVSLPLLLATNLPLAESVFLLCLASSLQTILTSIYLRKFIPWKMVIKSVFIRSIAMYFGVKFLFYIANLPIDKIKQFFGILILIIVIIKILYKPKSLKKLWVGWSYISFFISGFMAGGFGIGGPALVIWVNSTNWEQKKIRAFLLATFALTLPTMIMMMYLNFPEKLGPLFHTSLYTIPFMLIGTFIGLIIGNKFSLEVFRKLTFIFLGLLAIWFILKPYII